MSGELAAAADIVTGAAIARTVEPAAGEGREESKNCLNCGTVLMGAHCHMCGQKAKVHRTLNAFGHDILHSVLHFDGKIWRTLPMLIWHPGELTRRYVHGERAKFVSPLALFLFTVFLSYAVFTAMLPAEIKLEPVRGSVAEAIKDRPIAAGNKTATKKAVASDNENSSLSFEVSGNEQLDAMVERATENPKLLIYKIQSNAYKYSWALIPISIPFVWVLFFWQRRFKIFDHAVFVTYSMTFMLAFSMVCGVLLNFADTGSASFVIIILLLLIFPMVHWYRQIRGAYGTSRFGAAWRTFLLSNFSSAALVIFALLIISLGIA